MVFLANLGVNLHVCLCGDLQVASAQTLDCLDIGQKSSFPAWKRGRVRDFVSREATHAGENGISVSDSYISGREWSFGPVSALICTFACAAYYRTPPHKRLIVLILAKNPHSRAEMVFLANLGVNLHVCLCGDLQVASAQTLDRLDIGQKSSFPAWKRGRVRDCVASIALLF
ncbi:exported hypothetical protein [uncultured Desulfatiglans sp.]|uniref:Uncharacterized protein n=1 Tax=Uncultured Desulfatiglans sp. TaxID=1748965 RepID=A0A653A709_UNCDX|nr:exported hypothetical protein [uncultured Desulfatiglans sp.]